MINYDSLDSDKKQDLKNQLANYASSIGGKNHFLSFIEAIRLTRPHPLMAKEACFRFDKGNIRWEKVIFKEKVNLLITLIRDKNNNLMPKDGDRNYKKYAIKVPKNIDQIFLVDQWSRSIIYEKLKKKYV